MSVRQISDQLEITALLNTYARAVDSQDWELWRSVFTEDARIDYSSAPGGTAGPRDQIAEWLRTNVALLPMTQHYITNVEIEVEGDTAAVRAMFYNPMQLPGVEGLSFCGGYYHHRLVLTAEGWRSRELREENMWFGNQPFAADTPGRDSNRRHQQ
ncbi:nuclear transport factor 2 family protein [Nocardia macrotermitis]|uniref:SnoaL-like domain-containing protein n=1 Tax=Nocardia macrotermitis TaxID=2585198 RepID=A0A7K0D6K4_9NOCA|nr:nuclear transport factor 2 family protein [Nocardia macrotermitis]MQY20952.1 hypothetical protein [Nocardia macrotermitis]